MKRLEYPITDRNRRFILKQQLPLLLMLLPGVVFLFIFHYVPLAGIIIAFQNFIPAKGLFGDQKWIGLENFKTLFILPDVKLVFLNTVYIAIMKIIGNTFMAILVSILLNEINQMFYKKTMQTIITLPNFLSWVIIGGIMIDILSTENGIVNKAISIFGIEPIYFLGTKSVFPYTVVISDIWKNFGFNSIIYLAAICGIDPTQYESALIDGAKRYQRVLHITLPGIMPIIILLATLSLGNILNAGFEQIFVLYSPQVYKTGDIIDTYVYRMGILSTQYSLSTAVSLIKSIISFILIGVSYRLAYKYAGYQIF